MRQRVEEDGESEGRAVMAWIPGCDMPGDESRAHFPSGRPSRKRHPNLVKRRNARKCTGIRCPHAPAAIIGSSWWDTWIAKTHGCNGRAVGPVKGLCGGLSRMLGNPHVRFLGEGRPAMAVLYPAIITRSPGAENGPLARPHQPRVPHMSRSRATKRGEMDLSGGRTHRMCHPPTTKITRCFPGLVIRYDRVVVHASTLLSSARTSTASRRHSIRRSESKLRLHPT